MIAENIILEAKRAVMTAQKRGMLYSPEDAWAVSGRYCMETLWSIANRVALNMGADPVELCEFLEKVYPTCTLSKRRIDVSRIWDNDEGFL